MAYAEKTSVSAEKSRAEIESTLKRYGADQFGYMTGDKWSTVIFHCKDRTIKIIIANLRREELVKSLGTSIISRMHEGGEVIECNWPSFRESK